jgi:hypothetical protein
MANGPAVLGTTGPFVVPPGVPLLRHDRRTSARRFAEQQGSFSPLTGHPCPRTDDHPAGARRAGGRVQGQAHGWSSPGLAGEGLQPVTLALWPRSSRVLVPVIASMKGAASGSSRFDHTTAVHCSSTGRARSGRPWAERCAAGQRPIHQNRFAVAGRPVVSCSSLGRTGSASQVPQTSARRAPDTQLTCPPRILLVPCAPAGRRAVRRCVPKCGRRT